MLEAQVTREWSDEQDLCWRPRPLLAPTLPQPLGSPTLEALDINVDVAARSLEALAVLASLTRVSLQDWTDSREAPVGWGGGGGGQGDYVATSLAALLRTLGRLPLLAAANLGWLQREAEASGEVAAAGAEVEAARPGLLVSRSARWRDAIPSPGVPNCVFWTRQDEATAREEKRRLPDLESDSD